LCVFGLAVSRQYSTAQGEEREEVCFIDVDVWGKQAESCHSYLSKGSPVLVEGRLRLDQWDDRETGKKRSKHLVRADRVQFLGQPSRARLAAEGPAAAAVQPTPVASPAPVATARPAPEPPAMPPFEPDTGGMDDDIPF
jgi:single-strand DNA-binding protein